MIASLKGLLRPFCAAITLSALVSTRAVDPRDYTVEVSATPQVAPPQITLKWPSDANAIGYTIQRKAQNAPAWNSLATLAGRATSWIDVSVASGGSYEYAVTKTTSGGYAGSGYLLAGINTAAVENRGKVVLIVDNTYAPALAAELSRLQQDLVGDGWTVLRHDISRNDSVLSVKKLILADYNADPANVKCVFLFGRVPVPYSGNLNPPPDGHTDHQGAWPADAFYGEVDGVWTDTTVNNGAAYRPENRNLPGDGKFDQSDIPSDVDLQVGRVDLSNLTCFANKSVSRSELDLLRAYLNKDHAFRHGQIAVPRRGLIRDTFGDIWGDNFASSGWRNSSSFFGAQNSVAVPYAAYFSTLRDEGYLWSYGAGGGTYTTCDGVGGSDDFATTDIKTVFTAFLGSYFGDWDCESAFLRAALGSGDCLASVWAGRPHWFMHHMALGETIGYSARISQNNRNGGLYGSQNWGTHRVHIALMGDPTLRLHPVIPPSNLTANRSGSTVSLNWNASPDSNIQGYFVYRSISVNGPFTRINGESLPTTLGMVDSSAPADAVYMVRAVKLEQSAGGTYYNPSVGIFSITSTPPPPLSTGQFIGAVPSSGGAWKGIYGTEGYSIIGDRASFTVPANVTAQGNSSWVWNRNTSDPSAVQRSGDSSRLAACWYTWDQMSIGVSLGDQARHRVSLYLLDWDGAGRQQTVELLDINQSVLHATTVSVFQKGIYLTYDVSGAVSFRIRALAGNAVLSALFIDPIVATVPQVATPSFNPASGSLAPGQSITLQCATPGATIRFTTDGSAPTSASPIYNAPFSLTRSGSVAARASLPGRVDSAVATAAFTVSVPDTAAKAAFLGVNPSRSGTWKGAIGSEGYIIPGDAQFLPPAISVSASGKSEWTWEYATAELRGLQRVNSNQRHASCAYGSTLQYELNFQDGKTHNLSLYCLDWDRGGRTQTVEVFDYNTGTVLQSFFLSNFSGGNCLNFAVKGRVGIRFTAQAGANAVLSGIFIDPSRSRSKKRAPKPAGSF